MIVLSQGKKMIVNMDDVSKIYIRVGRNETEEKYRIVAEFRDKGIGVELGAYPLQRCSEILEQLCKKCKPASSFVMPKE